MWTRAYLLHHIETIHEGKANYDCEFCGKVFKDRGNMRRHQIHVHEGKRFDCETCGKSYSQPNNLKIHIKNAHEGLSLKINKGSEDQSSHRKPTFRSDINLL